MATRRKALQTVTQAAAQTNKTRSWIHQLIAARRVPGAIQFKAPHRGLWLVPSPFKYIKKRR